MTILIFFAVLFVLILVHEWGHFIVAKKTGMRVDEFGIGFPPKLFGIKKGGTEYTLNLIPIGGFVRIYGENAQDAAEDAHGGVDISQSFTSKNKWAQSAVLIAGVTMNVLFAWLLFTFVFAYGVPTIVEEVDATENSKMVVTSVIPQSPAQNAGIPTGAEIIGFGYDTQKKDTLLTPAEFKKFTTENNGRTTSITYVSKGEERTLEVVPVQGLIPDTKDQYAIGVSLALVETVRKPIPSAMYEATITTYQSLVGITAGLLSLLIDIVQNDADLSQVAGPIGIVNLVGDAAQFGFASLLMFTAIISLNLAVINMLPIPALDGGRLVFVAIEAIIKRPINPVWVARVNTFGFVFLLLLMVAVTYSDIGKLL